MPESNSEIRERLVKLIMEKTNLSYSEASTLYIQIAREVIIAYARSVRRGTLP